MELKWYIEIFRKYWKRFATTVLIVFVIGFGIYAAMPNNYKVTFDLNVTRTGKEITGDYQYDSFYRLQADERFADTVVRWLGTSRIQQNILDESTSEGGLRLKARRLSSQMIEVSFVTNKPDDAQKVATAILNNVNELSMRLNQEQKLRSWFKVVGNEPFVEENKIGFLKLFLICVAVGIFLGFWVVFITHYFRKE